jgi:hypothetical protein
LGAADGEQGLGGGFALENDDYLLRSCARFAAERGEAYVRTSTAIT